MTNNIQKAKDKLIEEVLERFKADDGEQVKTELFHQVKKFVHETLKDAEIPTANSYCDAFAVGLMSSIAFWERNKKDTEAFEKLLRYGAGSALWYVNIEKEATKKKVNFLMENGGDVPRRSGGSPKIIKKEKEEED